MSTVAGMYFMRAAGQDIPTSECSVMDSEANLNLSEDENTSCSNSEMGCDLSLTSSNNNNKPTNLTSSPTPLSNSSYSSFSSSSRKNKRKNFKPRNITEYAGSDEEAAADHHHHQGGGGGGSSADVGMKLRQRLSASHQHQAPTTRSKHRQHQHQQEESGHSDNDAVMREDADDGADDEDDQDDEEENPLLKMISSKRRNGFARNDDDDDDVKDENDDTDDNDDERPFKNRKRDRSLADRLRKREDASDEEVSHRPHRFSHRDAPLDLSEVQNADSQRLWKKAKQDTSSIHSAIQSLMTNLNNNIDPLADPSSYLSHQVAMAAAAAAATGNNINPMMMGLPGSMGIDLRLGARNADLSGEKSSATAALTVNSKSGHHYNLRGSSNHLGGGGCGGGGGNNENSSANDDDDEDDDDADDEDLTPNDHDDRRRSRSSRRSSSTPDAQNTKPSSSSASPNQFQSQAQLFQNQSLSGNALNLHSLMANASASAMAGVGGGGGGGAMNDFAESTMKELLGLYGIAENLRQAGGKLPGSADILGNLHRQQLEGATGGATGQHAKMMLPENMARFLAAMQESVVTVAAAAAAAANQTSGGNQNQNQNAGGGATGSNSNNSNVPVIVNGSSASNGSNNNVGGVNLGTGNGNENSSSGTANNNMNNNNNNNNNNASSSSASSTPNPSQMVQQIQQHRHSSSPTLNLNHLNQLNHQHQTSHHQHPPLNFANISSLVQSSGGSPNHHHHLGNHNHHSKTPTPPNSASGLMGNHPGGVAVGGMGGLYGSGAANALLKSAKTRSSGRSPTGRGLTAFPVIREGLLGKGSGPVDYTRYVRRYGNAADCGYHHCRELNYREHFHCLDCSNGTRVFVKKEEMIRHFKWHKKRDESLQHGFMRYSPMDDCSDRFLNCQHNRKQTHYHCLKDNCEKVYISTSDVQMHANYHRKDSAIIQEGFQRFRAVEDCGNDSCTFRHQRTTHFHCRRPTCSYTFKNKADMEKHKSYHVKDEQLNRDGFKKFMKHETCNYTGCRFSRVCNHIHCIRDGCNYVLHSSGQLYSHKRKHERRDSELAYRRFKLAQSLMRGTLAAEMSGMGISESMLLASSASQLGSGNKSEDENCSRSSFENFEKDRDAAGSAGSGIPPDSEEIIKKFIQLCQCDASAEEHFHCKVENCRNILLGSAEAASDHSRNHEIEERISSLAFFTVDPASFDAQDSTIPCVSAKCPFQNREKHYHCLWDGCTEIVLATDEPFRRLEHFRTHQITHKQENSKEGADKEGSVSGGGGGGGGGENTDGFFRRKRGRPPKNRMIEVSSGTHDTAIFTSFKLPKQPLTPDGSSDFPSGGVGGQGQGQEVKDPIGFLSFPEGASCPDTNCPYHLQITLCHYHCGHPRCHFSVSDVHKLSAHLRDFHSNVDILEGYCYYDRNYDCGGDKCDFRNSADHFHCTRDSLTFVQYAVMMTHEAECHETSNHFTGSGSDDDNENDQDQDNDQDNENDDTSDTSQWSSSLSQNQVIKASGTFFPVATSGNHSGTPGGKENNNNNPMDLSSPNGTPGQGPGEAAETSKSLTDHSLSRILQLSSISTTENSETQFGPEMPCGRAFCKLKKKHHYHCTLCNQAFSELDKLRPHVLKHSSFSPLKPQTDSDGHYNTDEDVSKNDLLTFPEDHSRNTPDRDRDSVGKIPKDFQSGAQAPGQVQGQSPAELAAGAFLGTGSVPGAGAPGAFPPGAFLNYAGSQSPFSHLFLQQNPFSLYGMMFGAPPGNMFQAPGSMLHGPPGTPQIPQAQHHLGSVDALMHASSFQQQLQKAAAAAAASGHGHGLPVPVAGGKRAASPGGGGLDTSSPSSPSGGGGVCGGGDPLNKKPRMQMRILKDEPVPTGYIRFRFNEDCSYPHCGYREHQTHFHCTREDCGYSFCDKTRFVQHTARHERLDTLMGGDFKQFRANISCGRSNCSYIPSQGGPQGQNKASHFHCSKCDFVCTDTNKVVAHRRQHQKLDSITAAGFEKFTPSQNCNIGSCIHSQKQTHYHCLKCSYAVLGLSQMSAHKYRHADEC